MLKIYYKHEGIIPLGDMKVYDTPRTGDMRGKASGDHTFIEFGKKTTLL